jgi:hypothetical protein
VVQTTTGDDGSGRMTMTFVAELAKAAADAEPAQTQVLLQREDYTWRVGYAGDAGQADQVAMAALAAPAQRQEQAQMARVAHAIVVRDANVNVQIKAVDADGIRLEVGQRQAQAVQRLRPVDPMAAEDAADAADAPQVPLTEAETADVKAQIAKLGDRDPAVRRAAQAALKAYGTRAKPILETHSDDEDPEVRMTVRDLLNP